MGMEAYDKMSFVEMTPNINETIGCANCHEARQHAPDRHQPGAE